MKKNEFYVTNGWVCTIFILLAAFAFVGTLVTLIEDGINDIQQMISDDNSTRIKARDMRINHYKRFAGLLGFNSLQEREDFLTAVELYRHNNRYESCIKNGYTVYVPDWTAIDDAVENIMDNLRAERKRKETNITDGTKS